MVYDPVTRLIDLNDASITENTRASYPLEYISNALPEKRAGHPTNIVFLTCDASGVMPPIARLAPRTQAEIIRVVIRDMAALEAPADGLVRVKAGVYRRRFAARS